MSLEINDETIDDALINEVFSYALKDRGAPLIPEERESLLQSVKEGLIYKTLLRQEAEKLEKKIPVEKIDREYRLFFAEKTDPEKEGEVKQYIENKFKEDILIEKICENLTPPQESHLRIFYEDNRNNYFVTKEFQYRELGFRYPKSSGEGNGSGETLHPQLHVLLSRIRQGLTESPLNKLTEPSFSDDAAVRAVIDYWGDDGKPFCPYCFSQRWKVPVGELTHEGLDFLEHLTKVKVSQVIDHPGESFLFTPIKLDSDPSDSYLGLFIETQTRSEFIPSFEEIADKVRADLWEEMRQIKIKAYLHHLMQKSTIRDISYI